MGYFRWPIVWDVFRQDINLIRWCGNCLSRNWFKINSNMQKILLACCRWRKGWKIWKSYCGTDNSSSYCDVHCSFCLWYSCFKGSISAAVSVKHGDDSHSLFFEVEIWRRTKPVSWLQKRRVLTFIRSSLSFYINISMV